MRQQPNSLPVLKEEAVKEVDKLETLTQQMVDEIFSFSELGFQEFETSRYVTGILENNGFHVEREVAGIPTAWVASYGSGKPVVAFITDRLYSARFKNYLEQLGIPYPTVKAQP